MEVVASGANDHGHYESSKFSNASLQSMQDRMRQRTGARPDLKLHISSQMDSMTDLSQAPLMTPASILTPPETPQASFDSQASSAIAEPEPFPSFMRAVYTYVPPELTSEEDQESTTIPINEKDMILVHSIQPNGWADGTVLRDGNRGWLPTNFCKPYDEEYMGTLLVGLTNVWEVMQGDEFNMFTQEQYARGIIAGVRKLLERSGCLSRESAPVSSQQSIRVHRKALLAELAGFTKRFKAVQERCQNQTEVSNEDLMVKVEEVLLKAYKIVTRAVRFLDCWREAWELKQAMVRGPNDLPVRVTPEPSPSTRQSLHASQPHERESGTTFASSTVSSLSENASNQPSAFGCDPSPVSAGVSASSQSNVVQADCSNQNARCNPGPCSPSCDHASGPNDTNVDEPSSSLQIPWTSPLAHIKRQSASHRPFRLSKINATSNHVLASDRLCTTHEAFLGLIGAFIGLHLQSRDIMELLVTAHQSVDACKALTNVVEEIWERDYRRDGDVDASSRALHMRLAELVNATREIFNTASADGDETFCLPEQSRRLVDAATACVRAAGDCVAKSRSVVERIGDFEINAGEVYAPSTVVTTPSPLEASTPEAASIPKRSVEIASPKKLTLGSAEKPLPATPPHFKRRTQTGSVDDAPLRPPPARPSLQRNASSQSDINMQLPNINSFKTRAGLVRQSTIQSRRTSETGLRKAGVQASRPATATGHYVPTLELDIPQESFFDVNPTPTKAGAEEQLKVAIPFSATQTPREMVRDFEPSQSRRGTVTSAEGSSGTVSNESTSARNSGASATSHASTRATTPDQLAHKQTSFESFTTEPEEIDEDSSKSHETEAQLLAETHAHELMINTQGHVIAGSLPALVERLTAHDTTPDALFVNSFFLTFRLFTTPVELAKTLIHRYDTAGDSPATGTPVRLRVCNIFKGWMEGHWDVDADIDALRLILELANGRLRLDLPSASRRLLELTVHINEVQSQPSSPSSSLFVANRPRALSGANISPDIAPPQPSITKAQLNLLKTIKKGTSACNILDLDPLEFARQWTIKQTKIFCAIQPEELLASIWTKKDGSSKSVNVSAMADLTTRLTFYVTETILQPEMKKRALTIKHWVKIAHKFYELDNYDAVVAIVFALNSSSISRLKKTWHAVSDKTKASFDLLCATVDPGRNWCVLRQRIQGRVAPCQPFLGLYLQDLTFVEAGNASTRQLPGGRKSQSVINFDKYIRLTRLIADVQRFQVPYKLTPVPEMQEWMDAQVAVVHAEEDDCSTRLYNLSLQLEPREAKSVYKGVNFESANASFGSQSSKESGMTNLSNLFTGLGLSLNRDKSQPPPQSQN